MAREPELSIKVKVDPQIKPTELKTSIERKVKQSGEKPQIDIDPNVDGIKKKVEDKLKNIKVTANITPVVDTEKLKTDIQQQINSIGDIPKVTVGVNVNDFSDELSKRLKEELKSVNDKLSYYLKNLTTNTAGLNSVVEGLFPSRGISNAVQSELKSVQAELIAGLKGVKSKVKPFKETDLFQIGDTESTTTIRRVEKLVKNIRDQFASLDNFYDADEEKFLDGFNSEFEKFQNNASETVEKLSALKKNLSKDKFSDLLDNEDFDAESTTKALTPLISFLKRLSTASIKTGEDYDNLYALFNNKNTNKLFDESNDHLTRMKTRVGDITAETKTAIEVTGELAKTLNKAIKDDNSGYLSDAEIKTYGAAFDEVLSNIATKQEEINTKKQRTVELENDLLTKTRSNREALKQELEEYKTLLKSFGVKGDEDDGNPKGKPKPKSKEPDKTPAQKPAEEPKAENQDALNNGIAKIQAIVFDINQEELQKSIDTIFAKVSAPIGFKPANGAITNIKQQLQEAFSDIEINATNVNLQNPKTENVAPKYHILNKDELHKLSMELSTASCLSFTDYKRAIQTFEDADYGKRFGFPELEPHDISIELAKELGNAMKRYDYDYGDSDAIDILKRFGAKTNDSGEVIDFENFVKNAAYKFFGPQNRNKITSQNAARLQELLQSQDEEIQAYASFIEKLNSKLVETKQFGPRAYFDDTDEQFSYSLSSAERDALSNFEHKSYSDEFSRNLHATLVEPVGTPDSFGYYFDDINTMVAEIYNLAQQRLIQSVGDLSGQTEAVKDQTSIPGKVTITDADVIVDVKNPVTIPGTVTVDPNFVQLGNSDDLQKNANALSSVKQSLNKISTSAEEYGTKIAAIGPSVQYVSQEVDNLSKSLENQITDLDLIAKKTDAYGTTANSVTLNTKDVAVAGDPINVPVKATLEKTAITVPKEAVDIKVSGVLAPEAVKQAEAAAPQKPTEVSGHVTLSADDVAAPTAPVDIPGKVTLKVEDVTPPKDSVKIPGKVELEVSDITPPKTAVELEGKVSNVTVDNSAKGKKKNVKDDVKKPEVIDLKGMVELKDEDIKRPNPLNLNGAVKIKAADVKIDDVEISKKEFDIAGNLILKNAKIVDAVKEAAGEAAKVKKKNSPVENNGGGAEEKAADFDRKAKEAHLGWLISNIGENRTYLQSAISNKDSNKRSWYAGKIADYEKDFEETTRELIENLTEEEQDWIKSLKGIKDLDLNDPKQIDELMADKTILWPWEESGSYLNGTLKAANMAGFYNVSETDKAKKRNSYEKEYVELIKQKPALIKAAAEAKKQYGEDSDAYKDAVKAKKENEESLRAIKADRQNLYAPTEEFMARNKFSVKDKNNPSVTHDFKWPEEQKMPNIPRGSVDGGYSNSPAVQSALADIHKQVQKRRSELLLQKAKDSKSADDKQAQQAKKKLSDAFMEQVDDYIDCLKASAKYNNDDASESAKKVKEQLSEASDSLSKKAFELLDVFSDDEIDQLTAGVQKKLDSANRIVERRIANRVDNNNKLQDNRYQNLIDNLSNKQKTYGTVEEAVAEGKTATDIQVALQKQQELVDKIAKAKVGTEEYNNAIQAAEENWKSVVAIIDTVEKKQKDLTKAVDSIEKKFYQLAEEASGSSNEKLKNSINGVITKAAALSAKNPNTYENYAVDYNELKRESYKANAQYTIWKSNYKKLEREGIKIAEGVEVARQMQTDGSLQNVKFDSIDNLLRQLNELEPQTDAYKEKLVEVKKIWEEIERKVKAVEEAENQAAKRESTKISNLKSVSDAISQNRATMKDVQKNYGTDYSFYGKLQEKDSKLKTLLDTVNESSDPVSAAKGWAQNNLGISPDKINSVTDAINQLHLAYREATQEAKDFNKEASREKSINKASMEVANLKATIHDYIAEHKKLEGTDVGKSLYELLEALNQSDAPEKIGELKKKYAELRAESKKLGLESKNLLDVFEKLFGQHLSTMITMAALHKMQDALRIVYQNVVEIDTAVTELRKVSEYTGKSLEEYMGRAAEQAQKLGVSISDYIGSTADWKRLGYSDEDAENMATYSTLLKNVGDGIDDVNTSSSYLISTLQGFGLLAKDAESVVDQIDKVANTQPITAQAIGEILTRSAASMKAANNDLAETISLGTAAYAVIQNAETVGTTLKSVSMYLRAAKSELEDAGESADGCANSVSELRSELKSLTGVDIMIDNKNFKSTYQILKELSQVWGSLSDVTQANVTEMIGGKRNANAVSALLNNFQVAEDSLEAAANSAGTAWAENDVWLDSIQGRLGQLDASFQALSQDVLSSGLVKGGVSFLTSIVKLLDKIINLTGALPAGLGIAAFATQLGKPKMTGFMIVPSNTPGGDMEQVLRRYFIISFEA